MARQSSPGPSLTAGPGVEALSSAAALPADFLAVARRDFAADAVLFVDVTTFHAYPPLRLGVRPSGYRDRFRALVEREAA